MATWQIICEPYIWGWRGTINGKQYDLVRFYQGDWRVNYADKRYPTLNAAKSAARQEAQ